MKIWHVGASCSPQAVDGVNTTIWQVGKAQALLGHQVVLIVDTPPGSSDLTLAAQAGLELIYIPANAWRYDLKVLELLLRSNPPQVVHMHSIFIPKQAVLAKHLVENCIPYIITPNAMAPQLLQRGQLKKNLYSWFVEKPRFCAASAIAVVTPREEKAVRGFVPRYRGIIRWVPNPVDAHNLEGQIWKGDTAVKRLVYLGRFDVLHKGIDILVSIARLLPEVEVHLYGTEDKKTKGWLERLKRSLPPNVHFHSPVFGAEKTQIMAGASVYIQTSRWEVFGVSIAEAMYIGVPCAIADTLNLAELFHQHDLGLVLLPNPNEAAIRLLEVLNQPTQLQHWSELARAFAHAHFHPRTVALNYLMLYQEAGCL